MGVTDPPPLPADPTKARLRVFARGRWWMLETDPRLVRRFWVIAGDDPYPVCPGCGLALRGAVPSTVEIRLPPGATQEAIRTGGLEALTPAMPIELGELWYAVCHPCLAARAAAPGKIEARIDQLVAEARAEAAG